MTKYIELEEAVKTAMTLFAPVNTATQEIIETSLRNRLSSLPAADVAPVRRGRWEVYMEGKYLMCSACKASFWDENGDGGTNFCPNCGARMDGDG